MNAAPHIVLAGGGNMHLLPGLALAEQLERHLDGASITFVGSGRPVERQTVKHAGHGYIAIPTQPPPTGPIEAIRFLAENFVGYWASRWLLREQQVSLVVGLGGYASGVMSRAAIARGLPTLLLEPNAVPSRVTRWLARSATCVCTAYEEVRTLLPNSVRIHVTGNPVRRGVEELVNRPPGGARDSASRGRRLLVLGGSGGAMPLNRHVPSALGRIKHRAKNWQIVHQTGPGQLQAVEDAYAEAGVDALAVTVIDELGPVLAESDLAICRGGGITLAELAAGGVPAVVVPNPDVEDDHQSANAQIHAAAGACRIIDERDAEDRLAEPIASQLDALMADDALRAEMAVAARKLAHPSAASDIASLCAQLLSSRGEAVAA